MAGTADDPLQLAAPGWAFVMYQNLMSGLGEIMAKVTVEQTDLDNLGTQLGSIADDLEAELAQLSVPAGSLDNVNEIVARLRNDVAVPAPDPGPPVPEPSPPGPTPAPAPEPTNQP